MRILFAFLLLGFLMNLVLPADGGEDAGARTDDRRRKFVGAENDPILQALGALKDERLGDEITQAAEAYYSSRFADAHTRIADIMAKHPESAVGRVLYDFLLLMDGAALGFSGERERAIETLNRLQARIENGGDDSDADNLAGVMSLKIDILEADGDAAAAMAEMDALIARFGGSDSPDVRWRVENAMRRKAILLEQNGERKQKDGPEEKTERSREPTP